MTDWKDLDPDVPMDPDNPFGEAPIDALVYIKNDRDPELNMDAVNAVRNAPKKVRQAPVVPVARDHSPWLPKAPAPAALKGWRRPNPFKGAIVACLFLAVLVGSIYFFIGVFQGRFLGDGTVPSRPGPSAPQTAPPAPRGK